MVPTFLAHMKYEKRSRVYRTFLDQITALYRHNVIPCSCFYIIGIVLIKSLSEEPILPAQPCKYHEKWQYTSSQIRIICLPTLPALLETSSSDCCPF